MPPLGWNGVTVRAGMVLRSGLGWCYSQGWNVVWAKVRIRVRVRVRVKVKGIEG